MPVSAVVNYVINVQGNASQAITQLQQKLSNFGATAANISKQMQQNQNLAMFESVASIFTQFGGTISQVSIIATSAARPIAVLSKLVGSSGLAAIGAAAGVALLGAGMVKAASATMSWIGDMSKLRKELIDSGYLFKEDATNLLSYERAVERATVTTNKLKVEIADKLAPAFQELVDAGNGVVRMLANIDQQASSTSKGSISNLLGNLGAGLGGSGGVQLQALGGLAKLAAAYGATPEPSAGTWQGPEYKPQEVDEYLRSRGAMPEYDPVAVGNLRRQQAEEAKRLAAQRQEEEKRLADELQRLYEEKQQAIADTLQKISETETQLMLQDWSQAARIARDAAEAAKQKAQFEQDQLSMAGGVEGTLNRTGNPALQSVVGLLNPLRLVADGMSALVDEIFSIDDMFNNALDQGLRLFADLPDEIFNIAGLLIPRFIRALPELASNFILLAPAIVWELVKAAPIFLSSIIEAMLQLPGEFVKQFIDAFKLGELLDILKGTFGKAGTIVNSAKGLIDLKGDEKRLFGIKLPSFDTGGMVGRDGLAYLHAGERVLNRSETRNYNGGSVGAINVFGVADARSIAEDLRNKLGPYGLNLSLSPRV